MFWRTGSSTMSGWHMRRAKRLFLPSASSESHLITAVLAAMLLSSILGYFTFRRIVHPIRGLEKSVKSIAAGDYDEKVPYTAEAGETGELARSIEVLKQRGVCNGGAAVGQSKCRCHLRRHAGAASLQEFRRPVSWRVSCRCSGAAPRHFIPLTRTLAASGASPHSVWRNRTPRQIDRTGRGSRRRMRARRLPTSLTSLPPGYLRISSSLGAAAPAHAVAYPLISQADLLGVVELATFSTFTHTQQAMLDELLPITALSLQLLSHNIATEELLRRTQEQAHQLEEQASAISIRARLDAMHSEIGAAMVRSQDFSRTMQECAEATMRGVGWRLHPNLDARARHRYPGALYECRPLHSPRRGTLAGQSWRAQTGPYRCLRGSQSRRMQSMRNLGSILRG